jgi:hypothetical protein
MPESWTQPFFLMVNDLRIESNVRMSKRQRNQPFSWERSLKIDGNACKEIPRWEQKKHRLQKAVRARPIYAIRAQARNFPSSETNASTSLMLNLSLEATMS